MPISKARASIFAIGSLIAWWAGLTARAQTAPTITNQPVSQSALAGSTVLLTVGAGGPGPFTYQWRLNGSNLPGSITSNSIITTVAGGGAIDGGPATNAYFHRPSKLALDSTGNLYVADIFNDRIRKIGTNGIIMTVAGNGNFGFSGDGGPATSAGVASPPGVALDNQGNIFVADQGNNRIRRIGTNGIITTIAGNGIGAYSGDGGPATNASLYAPQAVALDRFGNLFIADTGNSVIREMNINGVITTVAGNGTAAFVGDGGPATNASLNNPLDLVVDSTGDLFIADEANNRVRQVGANGIIATVAGNGGTGLTQIGSPATNTSIYSPTSLALEPSGNLLIGTDGYSQVLSVGGNGVITLVAGNGTNGYSGNGGPATNAEITFADGLVVSSSGILYITDSKNGAIRQVATDGIITTIAGGGVTTPGFVGNGFSASNAPLNNPFGVDTDLSGNL